MKEIQQKNKGLLLKVIEKGLKIWIKSKCKKIKSLDLDINSSSFSLLKGNITNVRIIGSEIDYKQLPIQSLELESGPIKLDMKSLLNIKIKDSFHVTGAVEISVKLLERALLSNRWRFIGNFLSDKLLSMDYLIGLNINKGSLEVRGAKYSGELKKEDAFKVSQKNGKIFIHNDNKKNSTIVPMDENIKIKEAFIKEELLVLNGEALVNP